ncbi:polysaccharide lyase family 8 super-sandwich domain-containing protein [Streptomyces radiopugnans]|uniref:polysaccharide lyase family 8 super-sandwich domain-containing protein n=1 Tax=Streptomyces radiopugnans TaxID=403935 RepID=UPI003F1B142A
MDPVETVRTRLLRELAGTGAGAAPEAAETLAGSLAPDATWPDVDYAHRADGSDFPPLDHLSRTLALALSPSPEHRATALNALEAWYRADPRSGNWWYNEIGVPCLVGDILLALADRLGSWQRARWGRWLADRAGPVEMTGQNLVWAQGIVLRRGLLLGDGELTASAVRRMSAVLRTTDGEGVQEDFSFHQHGPQLYSGGYGASLTADLSLWIHAVHGTPWAFGAREVGLFTDFLLDGQQWAVHGDGFDFTTMGREITRAEAHRAGGALRTVIRRLSAAGAPRPEELAAFDARLAAVRTGGSPAEAAGPVGCRAYPRSDYLVHRRPAWSVSVRMSSTRTVPTESLNGENLRGRHLGDGVAAIRVGGGSEDGYRAVLPLWDWARLPGVTAEQCPDPAALSPRPDGERGASPDTGVWSDGRHGIAVMRLAGTDRFTDGWKAWFCFDDLFVALGTGITAPSAGHRVLTTVDQRLAEGPPVVASHPDGPRWVHHGRIGYVPLSGHGSLCSRVERRTGSWADVTATGSPERLSAWVFHIGFDHGPRPDGAAYACLVLPGADRASTAERARTPGVTVLSNTPGRQSVRCDRSGVTLTAHRGADGPVLAPG